jgi:hypothetical protein
MNEDLNQEPEQGAEQQQESVDPIVLLGQELQQIREALGLGESPASSSLMQRLNSIESKLAQPERQRNLPPSITWEQAGSLSFMRKSGITLEDINSGRVQVTRD